MQPNELAAWMHRMDYDKRKAAYKLGVSVRQIERYLAPKDRESHRGIPETVARLAACLERERG